MTHMIPPFKQNITFFEDSVFRNVYYDANKNDDQAFCLDRVVGKQLGAWLLRKPSQPIVSHCYIDQNTNRGENVADHEVHIQLVNLRAPVVAPGAQVATSE